MEVTGKLVKKLELETGTSKSGKEWQKQSIVIDTGDEFNNLIAVSAFGDKIDRENLQKFMLFTNDLDQSRKQQFREVHGELLGYIEDAGFHWQNDTRFFGRSSD